MASIDTLADKDAIRELLATYCFHLDNDEFDEMAALFAPDGVWETAFGTGTGRAGIVAQARSIATGERPARIHQTTNIVVEIRGETASVRSNWLVFQNSPTGPVIASGGAYYDQMVKRDGRWYFQHRRIDRFVAPAA
jgi:uncharacterized protein (TIGR02246 family)